MNKITTTISSLFLSLMAVMLLSPLAHAAPSGLYLNPSNGSYETDKTFTAQLRLGDNNSTGVQANMDFDTSKLTITGTSNQGSAFSNTTANYDNNAGTISVYAVNGSGSGDRLITTITFRTIATGNAAVNFARTNQTLSYVLLVPIWSNVSTTNASYTITAPPVAPSQNGSGSTSSNPTGGPSTAPPSIGSPSTSSGDTSTKSDTNTPTTPSPTEEKFRKKYNSSQGLAEPYNTLPIPDDPYALPLKISSDNKSSSQYLPAAIIAGLTLVAAGIFLLYHRTHLSHSLRRLLAAVTLGFLKVNVQAPVIRSSAPSVLRTPLGIIRSLPRAIAPIGPKLLAYTSPKLLASGIKKRLLLTANTKNSTPKH